jgi:peptidoglycan-N-acetylglucosamine deacetylase
VCALVKTPEFVVHLFKGYTWHFKRDSKSIYLTFDDGPIPIVTPWVLNLLKQYNAKATFFCIGENALKHPIIFKSILEDNHRIGNHTFNHLNGLKTKTETYVKNTEKSQDTFAGIEADFLNNKPFLFRPPYGKIRPKQAKILKEKGFDIILWDVLSRDFDVQLNGKDCLKNVKTHTLKGSILVFHDSLKAFDRLKYVLPKVLKYYSDKGYSFKSIKGTAVPN